MVLPDSGIQILFPMMQDFQVADSVSLGIFSWNGSSLGSNGLWTFDHMRVILCLRVNNCRLIMSADPITQGPKTSWITCYVLFSHPSAFFQIMCLQSLTFRMVLSMYLWLGNIVYKLTLYCLIGSWEKSSMNVQQGIIFVTAQVCQGFSPLCEWKENGCLRATPPFVWQLPHAVFHLSI
jgi:hypothetical protein